MQQVTIGKKTAYNRSMPIKLRQTASVSIWDNFLQMGKAMI